MARLIRIGKCRYYRISVGSTEIEVLCYGGDDDGEMRLPVHWLCAACFDIGDKEPGRLSLFDPRPLSDFVLWSCSKDKRHRVKIDSGLAPSNTCAKIPKTPLSESQRFKVSGEKSQIGFKVPSDSSPTARSEEEVPKDGWTTKGYVHGQNGALQLVLVYLLGAMYEGNLPPTAQGFADSLRSGLDELGDVERLKKQYGEDWAIGFEATMQYIINHLDR